MSLGGLRQHRAHPTCWGPCKLKLRCTAGPCALKARCTSDQARMVTRNVHKQRASERARKHVRSLAGPPKLKRSARKRRRVQGPLAPLKRTLGLRRLRLHGPTGAGNEVLLAATAQSLRPLARSLVAPPPAGAPVPA